MLKDSNKLSFTDTLLSPMRLHGSTMGVTCRASTAKLSPFLAHN